MGENIMARKHNKIHLKELIDNGYSKADKRYYEFTGFSSTGIEDGFIFRANLEKGTILRINEETGAQKLFGIKEDNEHAEGRMNIAMITPYDSEVFKSTNPRKFKKDCNGNIFGVEFNCYVQEVIEVIRCKLESKALSDVANHRDGCPLHNWIENIESIPQWLNTIHGAVFNSMLKTNSRYIKIEEDSNKLYTFKYLPQGISGEWIQEFMYEDKNFNRHVNNCVKSIKNIKKNNGKIEYIPENKLIQLVWFLEGKGYWK